MKSKVTKSLLLTNHVLIILHMGWLVKTGMVLHVHSLFPFLITTLMLTDIIWITSRNIRGNAILFSFCKLLALESWYVLLSFETTPLASYLFLLLSPVILLIAIRFVLNFLFQGGGYRYGKITDLLLVLSCNGSIIGQFFSKIAYARMYGIQFLVSILCFLFIIVYHRKRIIYVLKTELKYFFASTTVTTLSFAVYYFITLNIDGHISNFGIYLPVLLLFTSVHGILLKEQGQLPFLAVFGRFQSAFIFCLAIVVIGASVLSMGGNYGIFIVSLNLFFVLIFLFNIVLEHNIKSSDTCINKESEYHAALKQLRQEETLKTEFANFLHDDILQDLLSVKNMIRKAHLPDVQDLISHTLEKLNILIRSQMQDYHPVILKNLTLKENYQNLIETVSLTFPEKKLSVFFECSDKLFLV